MSVAKHLLMDRGIQPIEAGGMLMPAQSAFCAKICSKIITSQFCIILLNNDIQDGVEIPNANVNMEYGLMLGFNKYVIPFQRETQKLPFNAAGLDTVKYSNEDFEDKAAKAIDLAISATSQETSPSITPDQVLETFLLSKEVLLVPLTNEGDRNLFELGRPLGFNMVMTFDGMRYLYIGNFTSLRPEAVVWRLKKLQQIVTQRFGSLPQRRKLGLQIDASAMAVADRLLGELRMWVLVTSDHDKAVVKAAIDAADFTVPAEAFSMSDISTELQNIG